MKERPILFGAPMVRATLDGRITQTRRVVKRMWGADHALSWSLDGDRYTYADNDGWHDCEPPICPYGQPGDRLWVRETFTMSESAPHGDGKTEPLPLYRADFNASDDQPFYWKPSIHMPRAASRITLEITAVRVERLQDISEQDAIAEGIDADLARQFVTKAPDRHILRLAALHAFSGLWESINGTGSWALNPWVWVIKFKRL